jgi:photosystem II stability/assembly factor-like uncharacterized protein
VPARCKSLALLRCLLLLVIIFAAASSHAHPYASGLTNTGSTIRFILNEPATGVHVIYGNNGATNDLGPLNAGLNSFSLTYNSTTWSNFSIVVSNIGSSAVTQISVDATNNSIFGPRGVAVNRNPATRNFGRIYICNANAGTPPAADAPLQTTYRGIYILNADTTDCLGRGTNSSLGGMTLGSSTTYGPHKIFVGPDDAVFIGDSSGGGLNGTIPGGASVWKADPDITVSTAVLKYALPQTNFGPCQSTPFVLGSTNAGNLELFSLMWTYPPGGTYNKVYKYNIGSGPLPWTSAPTPGAAAGSTNSNGVLEDLYLAPDGKCFTVQNVASSTSTNPALRVFDSALSAQLWDSYSAAGGNDPFLGAYGIAVSPDGRYVAVIANNSANYFLLCQLTNGLPDLSTFTTNFTGIGTPGRGIAFDAADNVYVVSGGNDRLRVFSLGLSTTAVTSNTTSLTNGTFQFSILNSPPVIAVQPQNQSITLGSNATFNVVASGTAPMAYQWRLNTLNLNNGGQIAGARLPSLTIAAAQYSNAGNYQVVVSNVLGSVTSTPASLSVVAPSSLPLGWSQIPNTAGTGTRHDDIYFTDPTNGWASQNNNLYHTTDGGVTWTTNLTVPGTHFRSVSFVSREVGFAGNLGPGSYDGGTSNSNILYRTYNGGTNWSNVPGFAEVGMRGLCAVHVLDSQHIYGGGRVRGPAYFIKSTDGGTNWSVSSLTDQGVMNGIMDVYFHDQNNGWACGMDTNSFYTPPYYGCIAHTTNGGASWFPVAYSTIANAYFWKMSWPTTNIGYCALQQNDARTLIVFYKTTDGGKTWVSNGIPETMVGLNTNGYHFYFQGCGFVSASEGWIGGASGLPTYGASFLHTVDGGQTWTPAGFNNTFFINRIRFLSSGLGFASGANLYVYNAPLNITSQPSSQVVISPASVALTVGAVGALPISYQWQKNGINSIGATAPTLVLNNVTRTNSGAYSVLVSNPYGALSSSNSLLTVLVPERLSPPSILPGGKVRLVFNDSDGASILTTNDIPNFKVQASTNLVNWTTLTNSLSITNGMLMLDDTWTNAPSRFYRVQENY